MFSGTRGTSVDAPTRLPQHGQLLFKLARELQKEWRPGSSGAKGCSAGRSVLILSCACSAAERAAARSRARSRTDARSAPEAILSSLMATSEPMYVPRYTSPKPPLAMSSAYCSRAGSSFLRRETAAAAVSAVMKQRLSEGGDGTG